MVSALPLVVLVAAASPTAPNPTEAVATYRGGTVTREEHDGWLRSQGREDDPAERRSTLGDVALVKSLEQAALAGGLDREPAVAFRLEEDARGLLVQALARHEDAAVRIADSEVEAELQAEKGELVKPRRVRLRNIFKKVAADAKPAEREAVRAAMQRLRQSLLKGADFDDAALHESDSETRYRGGAMGAVPPGVLQPDVERVAFGLKPDELSPVMESAEGFTILRCDGFIEGRVMPLEEARQRIRDGLWWRKVEARRRGLREELVRGAAVQDLLDTALAQGGDDAVAARFLWGTVTLGELRWLSGQPVDSFSREALQSQLEEHVYRIQAAERARTEGLDGDPELRARIRWAKARTLATFEITRRVNQVLVPPSPAEVRARFEANRKRYERAAELDFSLILLPPGTGSERQRAVEADEISAGLRSGARDFGATARAISRHGSRAQGGRLGWHTSREIAPLGPSVLKALEGARPGEVVGPVRQDDDLYIVKLWGRRPARPLGFDEASRSIEKELGNARVAELQKKIEADARKALGVVPLGAP